MTTGIHQLCTDERFILLALDEASLAYAEGEVPVGAVIALGTEVIAKTHNRPIALNDPTAHAEILAIRLAAERIGNYRLGGTSLYVTLEPCIMCAGAIIQARIGTVVYGAGDPKAGAVVSLYNILTDGKLNHTVAVRGGVQKDACAEILSRFFHEKRVVSTPSLT
jgi:tRNA(adenine34) deaminase